MLIELVIVGAVLYFIACGFSKKHSKLPPGPYQWPIVGNLVDLIVAGSPYPHRTMEKLSKKYGDVMSFKLGVHKAVVISSFDAIKELLMKDEFSGRYDKFPFIESRSFHKILGIVFGSGPDQKEIRRYTIRNLRDFGFGKRAMVLSIMQEEIQDFLSHFNAKVEERNGLLKVGPPVFALSVVNVLWAFVAGFRYSLDDDNLKRMIHLTEKLLPWWNFDNLHIVFPALAYWFPEMTGYNQHLQDATDLQDFLRELIYKIKNTYEAEGAGEPRTFIECFLKDMENSKGLDPIFTEEQLITVLQDLFHAGSDTSSNTLSFALLYMVLYPKCQKRVQDEIDLVTGGNSDVFLEASQLPKMPYTAATIMEILRISHLLPLGPPRRTMAEYNYKGYTIPKDILVFVNQAAVMTDKSHWGDPEIFRPERFLDKTGTQIVNTERVIAFGYGKRNCLGEALARDTVFTYFTTLLHKFTFKLPPGCPLPSTEPILAFTMSPKPFDVVVIPRS